MNKRVWSFVSIVSGLWLNACGGIPFETACRPELPSLPPAWAEVLPEPRWRIEWINGEGRRQVRDTGGDRVPELDFSMERAEAVLAYPYWPDRNLPPGVMRPAGGIFPFDARGGRIRLSWRGGLEAWVWRELSAAADPAFPLRRPELFDWPRFRALLEDPVLPEEVLRDPWTADWGTICRKTVQSGFDRRRIVAESRTELSLAAPGFGGRGAGTSPFAEPVVRETGESLRLRAGKAPETFVSAAGILRCTETVWIWMPFEN